MVLENVDAIYIISLPKCHYEDIKKALNKGKHVLCEIAYDIESNSK